MIRKTLLGFTALLVLVCTATPAFAGWTVTTLNPREGSSYAYGVSGGQQVGSSHFHAGVWSGTAASFVDLYPVEYSSSMAYGVSGGQQVGHVSNHAALWSGTASSLVDLHPPSQDGQSCAYGISGGQQVGDVNGHASLWSGTAESWIDLHPSLETDSSRAYAVSNGRQGGYVLAYGGNHAALWSGSAASFVDLNPAGIWDSEIRGMSDDQQVGFAEVGGFHSFDHAALWNGTADTFVDLHPAGFDYSYATGVSGGWQVGYAFTMSGYYHASLWNGTSDSWFDLGTLLGTDYTFSEAFGIDVVGDDIWVSGDVRRSDSFVSEAVMWHYTRDAVPEPSSILALGSGLLALGGLIRRRR